MYLPFLRGKLFELKAIKEFIEESYNKEGIGCSIMPIIEPVNKEISPLKSCIDFMKKASMPFSIVLNSKLGDYKFGEFDYKAFLSDEIIVGVHNWSPAFEVSGNAAQINSIISSFNLENVMLIFLSGVDYENDDIQRLFESESVSYVCVSDLSGNRSIFRKLNKYGKKLITLDDKFKPQPSNWEYRNNVDHLFSDVFSYYQEDGFFGFSDYTALPSNYKEGGILPPCVAIHMTYKKNQDEIYVHHFLSDSRNGSNDIRGEFMEANRKILPFFADKPRTKAIDQITKSEYPGLGAIKKFSIKNHLELISRILNM